MKNILFIFIFLFFVNTLLAQTSEKGILVKEQVTETTSYHTANDLETFKNQFEEWNVGNLHVYSRAKNSTNENYHFAGKKVSPYFQQHFPKSLKNTMTQSGTAPYHVASIRGNKLNDYYILRINDGRSDNVIVLYSIKNEQLYPKKTLAYFYEKNGRTFQRDSWIQDVNGDTRLDLIQKTKVIDANGNVKKEKTKVYFQNKKGKFKRTRKAKINKDNYMMQSIK